ncbi:MAG: hypothetical protein WCL07_00580 [bacterium]
MSKQSFVFLLLLVALTAGALLFFRTKSLQNPLVSIAPPTLLSTPTPTSTLAPSIIPIPSPSSNLNIKTFTSEKLGITFKYQEKYKGSNEVIAAKEIGSKVYVYSSNMQFDKGQYVELFDKDASDSIDSAIAKSVLFGYLPEDCPITIKGTKGSFGNTQVYPDGYNTATIGLPASFSKDMETAGPYVDKCPSKYLSFGGVAYFLIDQAHPTKLAFFSIGQYALTGDKADNSWQDTFRFITCPSGAWVDCMPGPDAVSSPQCQPEYLKWAKDNCPGFQGGAL